MTDERQLRLKDIDAKLERILTRLGEMNETQQELHRAVFGDDVTKTKSLRDELHEIKADVEEITTWLDRLKWTAGAISLTNIGSWILAWIGIKT